MSDLVKRLRNPDDRSLLENIEDMDEAADAIERKDAAIAELVGALKPFAEMVVDGGRIDFSFTISHLRHASDVVAKYDIPKDGL